MAKYSKKKENEIINYLKDWLKDQKVFKRKSEMAKFLQTSQSHLNNIISGRRHASDGLLSKIIIMTEFDKKNDIKPKFYASEKRPYKNFCEELRLWFSKQKRWSTQKEIAEYLDMPYSSFRKFFQGRNFPEGDIRAKLYEITGIETLKIDEEKSDEIKKIKKGKPTKNSPEKHFEKINNSTKIIQNEIHYLQTYINENKGSLQKNISNKNSVERFTDAFYDLSQEILSLRDSNIDERKKIRNMISPKDVGYVISFLKALFDEDKFSDFIFFSKYEFEKKRGEK